MGIAERRKREKLERKQTILKAALSVYEAEGYLATTMEKIAERAELSKATLYLYFKTKDEIFVHVIGANLRNFSELLEDLYRRRINIGEPLLESFWDVFKQYYDDNPVAFQLTLYYYQREMIRYLSVPLRKVLYRSGSKNVKIMHKIAEYGVNKGLFKKCNPKTLAEVIWTSFLGIILLENSKTVISQKTHMNITRDLAMGILRQGIEKVTDK
ncbi:MAG: TetR/AcrR family transcriptional regulator [Deltaproteobacteria bacterium]|nr:TetR/AcrR family transcriptional regulator [Deltaproteobacteria bacterium]